MVERCIEGNAIRELGVAGDGKDGVEAVSRVL